MYQQLVTFILNQKLIRWNQKLVNLFVFLLILLVFINKSQYDMHILELSMKILEREQENLVAPQLLFFQNYCNLMRNTMQNMSTHLTEKKPDNTLNSENRFECSVCLKSYKNKRHLYRHQKEECVGVEPKFRCEVCCNMFRRKYHLSRHMLNRHRIKPEFNVEQMYMPSQSA